MKENDIGVDDPSNWKGQNLLGICLTKLRNDLKLEVVLDYETKESQ